MNYATTVTGPKKLKNIFSRQLENKCGDSTTSTVLRRFSNVPAAASDALPVQRVRRARCTCRRVRPKRRRRRRRRSSAGSSLRSRIGGGHADSRTSVEGTPRKCDFRGVGVPKNNHLVRFATVTAPKTITIVLMTRQNNCFIVLQSTGKFLITDDDDDDRINRRLY